MNQDPARTPAENGESPSKATPSSEGAPPAAERGTSYGAVDAAAPRAEQGETVAGGTLLVAAYAVAWVVVLLFVVRTFRRQTAVAARLDELERAIQRKKPEAG
jgi:CcmD family protein